MPSHSTNSSDEIVMYTTDWCADCWRAKQVMQSLKVPYLEVDITTDEDAFERVLQLNNGRRSVPTIVFPDGSVLIEPSAPVLVQKLQHLGRLS
jgi:mycoredoxin